MKPRHTPGPWSLEEIDCIIWSDTAEVQEPVAEALELPARTPSEQRANAQLIAAAPVMFAWIQSFEEFISLSKSLSPENPVTKDLVKHPPKLRNFLKSITQNQKDT